MFSVVCGDNSRVRLGLRKEECGKEVKRQVGPAGEKAPAWNACGKRRV